MLMGCVCSKGIESDDRDEPQSLKRLVSSSKKDEVLISDANGTSNVDGGRERLISNSEDTSIASAGNLLNGSEHKAEVVVDRIKNGGGHQKRAALDRPDSKVTDEEKPNYLIPDVPNGFQAEHVAAGWPAWLTAVAGEAVKGWLPRKSDSFEKLNKIGQGTYSSVYKARDLATGKLVALKKVRFVTTDSESVRFMAREIYILRTLDHQNVVKLEGLVASRMSSSLYLVFEYMEHDLAGLLATPGIRFTESQVKCYMQQLLSGLYHCHTHGVLHRDIKGSNLLIDNDGVLKIADFGLATFFNPVQRQPLTSRVVTLWYRPPELLLGATEYGVSVDLWSSGCILAELLARKPIMPGRTEVEQLHRIFRLCGSPSEAFWTKSKLPHATIFKPQHPYQRRLSETFKDFPPSAVALLDTLLAIEPEARGTAASALKSEFFTTKPLACDPSSLPKYPPSKELDAKLRDEEARRQRAAAIKGNGISGREGPGELRGLPVADFNADRQKQRLQADRKSISDKCNPQEDSGTGFPVDCLGGKADNGFLHPGISGSMGTKKVQDDDRQTIPSHASTTLGQSHRPGLRPQMSYMTQTGSGFSNLSGPLAPRSTSIKFDNHKEGPRHPHWPEHRSGSRYQFDVQEASGTYHLLERPSSSHKKNEGTGNKDSTATGYFAKKNRIHYSGPLMPPGGNLDEMLNEHERQIQQAVRKARLDKGRAKNHGETGLSESLLFSGRNGRSDA